MAIKRGVADAAQRLYNERNYLKWDSSRNKVRWADVIELTHPTPVAEWQSALFKLAIDARHYQQASTAWRKVRCESSSPVTPSGKPGISTIRLSA